MSPVELKTKTEARAARAFNPSRGGHAPGYLRSEFADLVEGYVRDDRMSFEDHRALWTLCGKLWNCRDWLPRSIVSDFGAMQEMDDVIAATYAQGSRFIRLRMRMNKPRVRVAAR